MHESEIEYMKEAYETNWMSTVGKNINEVERMACEYIGCKYAVALSAGTASLHLSMKLAGIEVYGMPKVGHGALEGKNEIFVIDMGEPVKIDTLARNLIRMSGYTPDVDMMVEYAGLRPGEKLFEEKLMAEEGLKKTKNDLIHIGCSIPFDVEEFMKELNGLVKAAYKNKDDMKERVQKVVTTYHPA